MKLSHLAGAALALMVTLAPASAALAQATYPPRDEGAGQVDDTSIAPGECVTFSGGGFIPGEPVDVTDNDAPVTTVGATPEGSFSAEVCPRVLGLHILRGVGDARAVSATVTVVGAGGLSETGSSNTIPMVAVGGGLVVAGAGAVVVASRRRRATIAA